LGFIRRERIVVSALQGEFVSKGDVRRGAIFAFMRAGRCDVDCIAAPGRGIVAFVCSVFCGVCSGLSVGTAVDFAFAGEGGAAGEIGCFASLRKSYRRDAEAAQKPREEETDLATDERRLTLIKTPEGQDVCGADGERGAFF
jgi:hypothetical protein